MVSCVLAADANSRASKGIPFKCWRRHLYHEQHPYMPKVTDYVLDTLHVGRITVTLGTE